MKTLSGLPPSILAYILLLTTSPTTRATFVNDFSAYPEDAQQCLTDAADASTCDGDTVLEMNSCLCGNTGNFVMAVADCVWDKGTDMMDGVYSTLLKSCTATKTPLTVSQSEFFNEGESTTTAMQPLVTTMTTKIQGMTMTITTTIVSPTATSTSDADTDEEAALSLSATVGIISSCIAAIVMLGAVIAGMLFFNKRTKAAQARRMEKPERPLLAPGAVTPQPQSPSTPYPRHADSGAHADAAKYPIGASVVRLPPHVAHANANTNANANGNGNAPPPSELGPGDEGVLRSPWIGAAYPVDARQSPYQAQGTWSELSAGGHSGNLMPQRSGTMRSEGTWVVSPSSSYATMLAPDPMSATGTMNTMNTMGTLGTLGTIGEDSSSSVMTFSRAPLHHQQALTRSSVSSWAHTQVQDGPYELPGIETREPVEADSIPVNAVPDRLSMTIGSAPPIYERGGWNDPITDKPH